ncbi:MAG: hypothetical protein IJ685_08320 [Selenomonadaceae bacterium]|nr:hypothetical protein [Selenomonadaceae bacterium]
MASESDIELFDRWIETKDKEEFVRLGVQLFPEMERKELEDNFDLSRAGYTGRKLTSEEEKMLNDARISAHNHFLKLCNEMTIKMANER